MYGQHYIGECIGQHYIGECIGQHYMGECMGNNIWVRVGAGSTMVCELEDYITLIFDSTLLFTKAGNSSYI